MSKSQNLKRSFPRVNFLQKIYLKIFQFQENSPVGLAFSIGNLYIKKFDCIVSVTIKKLTTLCGDTVSVGKKLNFSDNIRY
jgi:hypothetical protein